MENETILGTEYYTCFDCVYFIITRNGTFKCKKKNKILKSDLEIGILATLNAKEECSDFRRWKHE